MVAASEKELFLTAQKLSITLVALLKILDSSVNLKRKKINLLYQVSVLPDLPPSPPFAPFSPDIPRIPAKCLVQPVLVMPALQLEFVLSGCCLNSRVRNSNYCLLTQNLYC